mmetsp:Transcript_18407/g.37066  ORF Transcript_18407/g.37066 Transcript_18407/m.37066 type:complete len:381 (+) Transcript_18407:19-1161(+)
MAHSHRQQKTSARRSVDTPFPLKKYLIRIHEPSSYISLFSTLNSNDTMKFYAHISVLSLLTLADRADAFVAAPARGRVVSRLADLIDSDPTPSTSVKDMLLQQRHYEQEDLPHTDEKLDSIAHKLRLQVYDVDTGVYGLESKDPNYGIETIRTSLHLDDSDMLGIELTEVAHGSGDHRGLVLVSAVHGDAKLKPIHVGDAIVGVFCGEHFKESTTGVDYEETLQVLERAKQHARSLGGSTISVELNRLVLKETVKVVIEHPDGGISELDAKAGDNLRLLLMHHNLGKSLYAAKAHRLDQPNLIGDCGGEGICGTCNVAILQGMEHLNTIGPQESSILHDKPASWRAACKTVVGADNQKGTMLRIRLNPQVTKDTEAKLHP